MPNVSDVVRFKYGSQSSYDNTSKDTNAVYFANDSRRLFVGSEEYTRPVLKGTSVPSTSSVPKSLYVRAVAATSSVPAHTELYYNETGVAAGWTLLAFESVGSVRYDMIQSLTDAQKDQARSNIGAASAEEFSGHVSDKENPHGVTKSQVGLGNVDNTSDLNKPVSAAQEIAIADAKSAGTAAQTQLNSHVSDKSNPHGVTAEQVGADPVGTAASAVSGHNVSVDAHNDIRLLISDLTTKLNNFLDSDDATLDELSELISAIRANAGTIEQLTSGKVNVSDIVDNLTTNASDRPLSAAQGVLLKGLIDDLSSSITSITGLPAVTYADNGKFLRVVDGTWSAVTIPSAEEATFGG